MTRKEKALTELAEMKARRTITLQVSDDVLDDVLEMAHRMDETLSQLTSRLLRNFHHDVMSAESDDE